MSVIGGRTVPEGKLQGALFDVDGTLVDTMTRWIPSWNDAGKQFGLTMSEDDFWAMAGWPVPEMVKQLVRDQKGEEATDEFVEEFLKAKMLAHRAREAQDGTPPPIAPVVELARAHVKAGVPIAAATSGLRDAVEHHLGANGLLELFPPERIVCAADLPPGRGKPKPDIFLRAAELLGAAPELCVVYEDAESGLQAGWEAGCQVVDVRDLPGYPLSRGLAAAMGKQRAERAWLQQPTGSAAGPAAPAEQSLADAARAGPA